ncbi:acyl-coenzyme A synthetase/AMP-(fatty) acid ligase [Saccharothrix tamanrassetensis]|uniref:Acyl-coenzyme A synthetase/AMP-(Fatty) acid ligase n=1 Tax=Saccharothrix tamanrassetensis TaxID=1051531 RepID=A0A841CQJ5_9PSEU|nr:class I adenylate-forming enzyme family protein [Saccharothrix tamanrassetensis]MBB5959173.1 acyl-coenzyme A synthetase/AMP-(fatty) acid ligase [Saccharothrix tamanrassetensis]
MREFVTDLLRRHGDDVPVFSHDHTVTHGRLRASVAAEAGLFAASGVSDGTTVAVQLPPSFTQLEVVLALWTLGARVISLDHRFTPAERAVEHALARPQFVVRAGGRIGPVFRERHELVTEHRPDGLPALTRHRLVQFSSGSTGTPKMIGRSTESVIREVVRFGAAEGMVRHGERMMLLNNTSRSFGLMGGLLHALAEGVHLVFPKGDTAQDILRTAVTHEVDFITGLPYHFVRLVNVADRSALRTVRAAFAGAEPMSPEVADGFARAYGFRVGECFGTTETGALTLDVGGASRPAVGRPLSDTTLRVRDGMVEVALDESPYLCDDGVTRYADGWLRTGDRGEFDARGNLRLLGRGDSLVVVRGNKVDLTEVEAALRSHPLVTEAIAVHDGVIEAYVGTESDSLSTEDMVRWCRQRLTGYKLPQRVHVLPALPRTSSGKLVRNPRTLAAAR